MKVEEVKVGIKVVPFQKTAGKVRDFEKCSAWKQAKENKQPFLYVAGFNSQTTPLLSYTPAGVGHTFNYGDFKPYKETEEKEPLLRLYDLICQYDSLSDDLIQLILHPNGFIDIYINEKIIGFTSISDAVKGVSNLINDLKKPYEYLEEVIHIPSGRVMNFVYEAEDGTYLLASKESGMMLCPKDSIRKITETDAKENE